MAKMNSVNLYVTINQIILKAKSSEPETWQELYRLLPYLRNSISCVVCSNLLVNPQTPSGGRCQHHICSECKGGKKKLKPACSWCKDCVEYKENKSLKILLQCYQKMCNHLMQTTFYSDLSKQASRSNAERGASNLISIIREGFEFFDYYQSEGGIPKSTYNILPFVYTNSSTQTPQSMSVENKVTHPAQNIMNNTNIGDVPNDFVGQTHLYPVMYPIPLHKFTVEKKLKEQIEPTQIQKEFIEKDLVFKRPSKKYVITQDELVGQSDLYPVMYPMPLNKITVEKKLKEPTQIQKEFIEKDLVFKRPSNKYVITQDELVGQSNLYPVMYPMPSNKFTGEKKLKEQIEPTQIQKEFIDKDPDFKRPSNKYVMKQKKGCRCGNATATPGKLTCCGQRCPCYVESKACISCRCRGCRNPHAANGFKMRPAPEFQPLPFMSSLPSCPQIVGPQVLDPAMKIADLELEDAPFSYDGVKGYNVVSAKLNGVPISPHVFLDKSILNPEF